MALVADIIRLHHGRQQSFQQSACNSSLATELTAERLQQSACNSLLATGLAPERLQKSVCNRALASLPCNRAYNRELAITCLQQSACNREPTVRTEREHWMLGDPGFIHSMECSLCYQLNTPGMQGMKMW